MLAGSQYLAGREFLRVSFDRYGRERSHDEQHDENASSCRANNIRLVDEAYRETGSASRFAAKPRDEWPKLISDLEADRFGAQVLVLWESSRGSRQVDDWVQLLRLLEKRRVCVWVTTHSRLYDPRNPRDRRTLLEDAIDSEYESAKTSLRVQRDTAAAARKGRPHGKAGYGYVRVYSQRTGELETQLVEPSEAAVIVELFQRLYRGNSLRSIARDFEARGVRTRSGKVFSDEHLRSVAYNGYAYVSLRRHIAGAKRGQRRETDNTSFYPGSWPPILVTEDDQPDRELFFAVRKMLGNPARVTNGSMRPRGTTSRGRRAVHLYSSLPACGVCGVPAVVRRRYDQPSRKLNYLCPDGHVRLDYEQFEGHITAVIVDYLSREDHPGGDLSAREQARGAGLRAVRENVRSIKDELDDLATQLGQGLITATLAAAAEPGILARLRAAEARETELMTPDPLVGLFQRGAGAEARWQKLTFDVQRRIAEILLTPAVLGQPRLERATGRGMPVWDRISWHRDSGVIRLVGHA